MHATPVLVVKVISTKSVVNVTFGFGLTKIYFCRDHSRLGHVP